MKAYKGTDKDLKCKGFRYEIGHEYETDNPIELCERGFHACKNPFDVFGYYEPAFGNRFFEVEQNGTQKDGEDKTVSSKIKINAELSFKEMLTAGFKFVFEKVKLSKSISQTSGDSSHSQTSGYSSHSQTSGDSSHSQTSGDSSHSQTSGYSSHSQTSGYSSHSQTSGKDSIACSLGIQARAMVKLGWIVIVDWRRDKAYNWFIKKIYHAKIGQKIQRTKIKPDTWYWFEEGKLKSEK